ncbi:MAG: hypothetical protein V4505_10010 [Pseudomonadota bacterium]
MTTHDASADASLPDGAPAPGEAAGLADSVAVPADLAALYLGMPPAQFDELCRPARPADGKRGGGAGGAGGRAAIQAAPAAAKQAPHYTLGELRAYENRFRNKAHSTAAATPDSGLHGWVTAKRPFFAELEAREPRGRRTLLGNAWDKAGPLWQERFAALAGKKIRFTWATPAEAAASRWADLAEHQAFADQGLALLRAAIAGTEAALAATAAGMAAGTAPAA